MAFVADDPEYHTTWLVRFFHSFPHVDLSFEETSANFTPDSRAYKQALGFWVGIPIIWCCLLWLALLIYFCVRCCSKQHNKQNGAGCSCCWAGFFLAIGCGALAMTFYGNTEVHDGVDGFVGAVHSANKTIESSVFVLKALDGIANDTEAKSLPALTQAIDKNLNNITVRTKIDGFLKQILTNVNSARSVASSIRGDCQSVDTGPITEKVEDAEEYRWTGTILVNCVYIGIFLFSFAALVKKSKWMLMIVAGISIAFMLFIWGMTSFYLAVGIGGGDFCTDPNSFVVSQLNGTVQTDLLQAYIICDDKTKPYQGELLDAQTAVTQAITALNTTINITAPFNITGKISGPANQVRNNLKFMFGNLSSLSTQVGSCSSIHDDYVTALQAVCYTSLGGVGYLVLFSMFMGLATTLLVFCSARMWLRLGRRRRRTQGQEYQRVDDSDPFLPDPPPYQRNYGAVRGRSYTTENRTINDEERPIMNLRNEGESPPAYQSGHYMQQYYSLAPTPSSVAQSSNTTA